jgi:putative NIF3 family GTP cyclohydrolase 1 type 2
MNKDLSTIQRREFISSLVGVAGSAMLISSPLFSVASDFLKPRAGITVGEIMDLYIKQLPSGPIANTVDTLKSGNAEMVVTGIVTCMFATIEVINKAVALGANFIIAHEPTFYNHQDATKGLENDDVYKYKSELLKKHKITVWRNHDYIHSIQPDGVRTALVEKLGWQKFSTTENSVYKLSNSITVKNLINQLKNKLDIPALRYIGNLDQPCSKILLMPGAAGGQRQIEALSKYKPDVLVTGEISEWETAEYVRDAKESGKPLALIVLGHIASEELGSTYMASWLVKNFPTIKTTFVKTGASLSIM